MYHNHAGQEESSEICHSFSFEFFEFVVDHLLRELPPVACELAVLGVLVEHGHRLTVGMIFAGFRFVRQRAVEVRLRSFQRRLEDHGSNWPEDIS